MTRQAELIAYVFEGQPAEAVLAAELQRWMDASSRFTAFVDTYRDKIRKKVRTAGSPEGALDLRAELETAYRLLEDRRFAVAYEPYASAKQRGPDFAVTYRVNQAFNIEVAHLRVAHLRMAHLRDGPAEEIARKEDRVLRILLDKLGQMQPAMPNLLVIYTQPALAQVIDLDALLRSVKTRAESKDPTFYALSRYAGPPAFYHDFLLLSGILLRGAPSAGQLWSNKQARPILDASILRLLVRLL